MTVEGAEGLTGDATHLAEDIERYDVAEFESRRHLVNLQRKQQKNYEILKSVNSLGQGGRTPIMYLARVSGLFRFSNTYSAAARALSPVLQHYKMEKRKSNNLENKDAPTVKNDPETSEGLSGEGIDDIEGADEAAHVCHVQHK